MALILTVIALANVQILDETPFTPGYNLLGKFKPTYGNVRNVESLTTPASRQGIRWVVSL